MLLMEMSLEVCIHSSFMINDKANNGISKILKKCYFTVSQVSQKKKRPLARILVPCFNHSKYKS